MLQMTGISKSFFGVPVLRSVDFAVGDGEVHALLGENGAGKSTLMNILAGVYSRDAGTVRFRDRDIEHLSVKTTEDLGIAFVHQELNLFNDLKVYENIFLRKELTTRFGTLDKKTMIARTQELFASLGVDIDPEALVDTLETSKKQLLEIAKALFANAELLILDEPTTALNTTETEHLFSIVDRLRKQGKSFIFISHKMTEIFQIADRYTVLRNGEMVQSGRIVDTNPTEVTRAMVGREYQDRIAYAERELGKPILVLDSLTGEGFHDVSLTIRRGEVVAFTGLLGSGISEMMQTIFGVLPITGGTITVNGERIDNGHGIHRAMTRRIGMVPSNRKENSVIPDFALLENNYVSEHTLSRARQYISQRTERDRFAKLQDYLSIKANSPDDNILSLSGGNQQKVILARWLNTSADVLLLDNPTQGIDVGAKAEIYRLIQELANSGKTILVNTLEIPEIQQIADRCIVFYHGSIQAELPRDEVTDERVMLCATNAINATEAAQ